MTADRVHPYAYHVRRLRQDQTQRGSTFATDYLDTAEREYAYTQVQLAPGEMVVLEAYHKHFREYQFVRGSQKEAES